MLYIEGVDRLVLPAIPNFRVLFLYLFMFLLRSFISIILNTYILGLKFVHCIKISPFYCSYEYVLYFYVRAVVI